MVGYAWRPAHACGVVLLQHGFGEHTQRYVGQYAGLIPRLCDAGLAVHGFDLPGHGASPGPRRLVDVGAAVELHRVARRALEQSGLPLFLFGHSLGGGITAASAASDPDHLHGVVLSGPALQAPIAPVRALAGGLATLSPTLPLVRLPAQGMTRSLAVREAVHRDPLMALGWMPAGTVASLVATNHRTWHLVHAWQVPTLVLHGDRDRFTRFQDSRRFIDAISARDRRFLPVADGYHETLNDPGGDTLADAIVEWLLSRCD